MEKKKDFNWTIENINYVIRNVPYIQYEDDEETYTIGVALKMAMIRDLMVENEIPHDVDFALVEDLEFEV